MNVRELLPKAPPGTNAALFVLAGLNVVDEFATHAVGLLAPEIRAAFNLSAFGFGNLFSINALVGLALIPVVGWLGDRADRVRLAQAGAILAGAGAVVFGLAPAVWVLVIGRILFDAGKYVPETIHNSLISDLYPPDQRPAAFGIHRGGNELGYVVAPLFGSVVATLFGWRAAFVVAAVPVALMLVASLRLREPRRGATEGHDLDDDLEDEPVPYGTAVRQLLPIRTLRRTWIATGFVLAGALPFFAFAGNYYAVAFGTSVFVRGIAGAINSIFGLLGLVVGGALARRAMQRDLGSLQRFVGAVVVTGALLLGAFALMPTFALAAALGGVTAFVFALNQTAQLLVLSLVSPPRLRSVAFSFGGLTVVPTLLFVMPIVGGIIDGNGIRVGLVACTPMVAIGGLVLMSAAKYADADHHQAVATLDLAGELRDLRRKDAGQPVLVVRNLDVSYGTVQVLFGVDLDVRPGEVIALLGTNGAGKSTLLKAVSGLLTPDRGNIFFEGRDIAGFGPWETAARRIVMMPGGKSVFPELTVRQNLDLATWLYRKDKAFVEERLHRVVDLFPRIGERLSQRAGDLSGGEQQQLSLAQALIPDPRILLLDELSLGLSPKLVGELVETIGQIKERQPELAIVLVEQSVNVAMTLAERAYFLEKGEVRFEGRTVDLLERRDVLRAVFLEGTARAVADS